MDILPTEMKDKIFSNLRSETLVKVVSLVCKEWTIVARNIVDRRLDEMKVSLPPHDPLEISGVILPSKRHNPLENLFAYERVFLRKYFHLEQLNSLPMGRSGMNEFFQQVASDRGCDCGDLASCLVRSIHFMPCFQLLLVQFPERIDFYSLPDVLQGVENPVKYSTNVKESRLQNVWIDNNTHTAVSVFKEFIVSQETTRALILFKVSEINHDEKTVILENVRRIFLPFWSCALIMMENKVCSLFTTGRIGVWNMTEDKILVSNNACVDIQTLRTMRESRLYRCNDLVLVKIVSESEPEVSWTVFDACAMESELNLFPFEFNKFIGAFCTSEEECTTVNDSYFSSNMLITHCEISETAESGSTCGQVFVKRLKRPFRIEDFSNTSSFVSLIAEEDNGGFVGESTKCPVKLSAPFLSTDYSNELIACCLIGFGRKTTMKHKHHRGSLAKSVISVRFNVINVK